MERVGGCIKDVLKMKIVVLFVCIFVESESFVDENFVCDVKMYVLYI